MPFTVSAQLRFELEELMEEVEPKGIVWPFRAIVAADDDDDAAAICEATLDDGFGVFVLKGGRLMIQFFIR